MHVDWVLVEILLSRLFLHLVGCPGTWFLPQVEKQLKGFIFRRYITVFYPFRLRLAASRVCRALAASAVAALAARSVVVEPRAANAPAQNASQAVASAAVTDPAQCALRVVAVELAAVGVAPVAVVGDVRVPPVDSRVRLAAALVEQHVRLVAPDVTGVLAAAQDAPVVALVAPRVRLGESVANVQVSRRVPLVALPAEQHVPPVAQRYRGHYHAR